MKINTTKITILSQKPLLKKNIKGLKNSARHNNTGKITIRHKDNGHKKKYRKINFSKTKISKGVTCSIEHDPARKSYIFLHTNS